MNTHPAMRTTGISMRFDADVFLSEPQKCVRFCIHDETGQAMAIKYDPESLADLDDDRIAALYYATTIIQALFKNVTELRNKRKAELAKEMENLLQEPVIAQEINMDIGPTGMSYTLPPGPKEPVDE